jgi:hypothetical protein
MADDRHEAYRMMFSTGELKKLFKEYEETYSAELMTYLLIQAAKQNPDATVNYYIDQVRMRLHEPRRSKNNKD